PYQSEARPSQADTGAGRHNEQASDHELSSDAGESTATAGNYAGGVAGDQEFPVGRDDEGQDRPSQADAPSSVPAMAGIGLDVLSQAEEAQLPEHHAADG